MNSIVTKKGSVIAKHLYDQLTHIDINEEAMSCAPEPVDWSKEEMTYACEPVTWSKDQPSYKEIFAIMEMMRRPMTLYYRVAEFFPETTTDPETQKTSKTYFITRVTTAEGEKYVLCCHPNIWDSFLKETLESIKTLTVKPLNDSM